MEKIKVNMSPNPLDVQTIHASQNDGEARQWEFELHNNGELIDTSDVKEQMVFKSYKGGTEQLLPENGSTPTTSPFKGDIKYPQGLLTDQEFTYRQSPTEEDGNAKITDIKGNTLVWNQQLNDTGSTTTSNGITFTKNADGSITLNGTATAQADYTFGRFDYINGHKYLINGIPSGATVDGYRAFLFSSNETSNRIITATRDDWFTPRIRVSNGVTVSNVVFRLNIFDLTKMGLDSITSVGEFTSLFPSYYAYNQGSLLSFNGNGIKTVGKNIYSFESASVTASGITLENNGDGTYRLHGTATSLQDFRIRTGNQSLPLKKGTYKFSGIENGSASTYRMYANYHEDGVSTKYVSIDDGVGTFTLTDDGICVLFLRVYAGATIDVSFKPMLTFDYVTDQTFEPYTSSTLSLPISTYFPNGMDGVGTDYDELTNTKATTRMTRVDLGSLSWGYSTSAQRFYSLNFANNVKNNNANTLANANCAEYTNGIWNEVQGDTTKDMVFSISESNLLVRDKRYTTASAFKTAVSGVYLVYPLATPIETSFTTASLVTENGEVALANENGVLVGKCNIDISAESGFHDAKIKLADADGECYSNKIQLHIERSPQ